MARMNQKNRVINVHNGEKYQKRTEKDQFDIQPELPLIKKSTRCYKRNHASGANVLKVNALLFT